MLKSMFKFALNIFKIYKLKRKNIYLSFTTSFNNKTTFEGFNRVGSFTRINSSSIGRCSYIGSNSSLDNSRIGRYSCIASNVKVLTATHPVDYVSIHPVFFSTKKQCGMSYTGEQLYLEELSIEGNSIIIGNDVWIGQEVILMGGIIIGDGVVIAAGSVVTKNVPAYAIVGGVPAKVIKYRFSENTIQQLEEIKWWNKPEIWISKNANLFSDIEMFLSTIGITD